MTSAFSWWNSVNLWPASFCTPRPNLPSWLPPFAFQSPIMKRTSFFGVSARRSYRSSLNSVQLLSHVQLFPTPWTVARQASLSITNSWSPPKPLSIELVMPSNHLILCCPLLLLPSIFPNIRVFSNESALCVTWPKYREFQLQRQSFQWTPRTDLL